MTKIKLTPKVVFIACVVLIAAVLLTLGLVEQKKVELTAALKGTWIQPAEGQDAVWLELRVESQEMESHFISERFAAYNDLIGSYRWKAVSKNQIRVWYDEVSNNVVTVSIRDGVLTFEPAITKNVAAESWQKAK